MMTNANHPCPSFSVFVALSVDGKPPPPPPPPPPLITRLADEEAQ